FVGRSVGQGNEPFRSGDHHRRRLLQLQLPFDHGDDGAAGGVGLEVDDTTGHSTDVGRAQADVLGVDQRLALQHPHDDAPGRDDQVRIGVLVELDDAGVAVGGQADADAGGGAGADVVAVVDWNRIVRMD